MAHVLHGFAIILVETFCFMMFADTFYPGVVRKSKNAEGLIRFSLLYGCSLLSSFAAEQYVLVKVAIIAVLFTLIQKFFNQKSIPGNFVIASMYLAMLLSIDYLMLMLYQSIASEQLQSSAYVQSIIVILSKGILFLIILNIHRHFHKAAFDGINDVQWLKLLAFPLFTIGLIIWIVYHADKIMNSGLEEIFWVIAYGLVMLDIYVFYFVRELAESNHKIKEQQILVLQAQNERKMYQKIQEDIKLQRSRSHEYKNRIESIRMMLEEGNISELQAYLDSLTGYVRKEMDYINTNHAAVNAVLNNKYREAQQKGILFVFVINDLSGICVSADDIVTILANLLNNAIEACERMKEPGWIKVKAVRENGELIIAVKNSYDGIVHTEHGKIVTGKHQKKEHGFGLKNVAQVVEKNDGDYMVDHTKEEFFVSVVIPEE